MKTLCAESVLQLSKRKKKIKIKYAPRHTRLLFLYTLFFSKWKFSWKKKGLALLIFILLSLNSGWIQAKKQWLDQKVSNHL